MQLQLPQRKAPLTALPAGGGAGGGAAPEPKQQMRRTGVRHHTLAPRWEETFVFYLPRRVAPNTHARARTLVLSQFR